MQIMKNTMIFSCILMILSCNKIEETKQNLSKSVTEKAIEAVSGMEIDTYDVENADKNSVEVDLKSDDLDFESKFKNGFGTVTATKETIAITVSAGENSEKNILIGFTGKDLTTQKPIIGKMNNSEGNSMSFSTTDFANNGMDAMISFEAEGEIQKISDQKVVISVKGKLGYPADTENPEKWKSYEGIITLNYPVFQAIGSSKEDFTY